jgi:hypothetical protein
MTVAPSTSARAARPQWTRRSLDRDSRFAREAPEEDLCGCVEHDDPVERGIDPGLHNPPRAIDQ